MKAKFAFAVCLVIGSPDLFSSVCWVYRGLSGLLSQDAVSQNVMLALQPLHIKKILASAMTAVSEISTISPVDKK